MSFEKNVIFFLFPSKTLRICKFFLCKKIFLKALLITLESSDRNSFLLFFKEIVIIFLGVHTILRLSSDCTLDKSVFYKLQINSLLFQQSLKQEFHYTSVPFQANLPHTTHFLAALLTLTRPLETSSTSFWSLPFFWLAPSAAQWLARSQLSFL